MALENSPSERKSVFKGVFMVLEAEQQDFYIINWRDTLENPTNHLCGLRK
ncbi:hypothetical protein E2C01_065209 [Portunus trituberculatus]|uniref:Uncharacterized protein n=1 Tax=Portunus trituberculatus TaxID=210409 RepID=A0A5B7HR41_PORTR|nr:hypothetical protein [Portunus trituberculatus]